MATLTSQLIVSLLDNVSAPSRAVAASVNRMRDRIDANNRRMDEMRGRMLEAGAVAYGLARAISAPISAATAFETKLEDIGQKANIPVAALPKLGAAIREVARDTTQSAAAIADGMDVLTGMGASQDDALGLLPAIGRAATAYGASVADLSQAGYAALSNLNVPAEQFAGALDAMAEAGKAGAFELKDMAQYFPALGAGYQALGQKGVPAVADLAAALQIVRSGTGDSASAATNLSNVLQKIRAPATVAAFKKMGVNLESELSRAAEAGLTPIEAIAEITNKALKGDLGKLGYLFADAQVQQGLRPLIQNIEEYRRIRAEALRAQGVVEEDYQRRLQTGAMASQRWAVALESLNLAIGSALLPALASLGEALVPIVNRMAAFAEANPGLTRAIVATTAALVALRVAALAAQFSFFWMKGSVLLGALGGLRGLQGAIFGAGKVFGPFAAAARAARTAMIGFAAAASIGGTGSALKMMGASLLSLLNPLRLVTVAMRVLKVAMLGTGIGLALAGIAAAGTWIYNNWQGIGVAFEAFKGAFMRALEPAMPLLQPVIDGMSSLFSWVSDILGPVDEMNGTWASWGMAAGDAVGKVVAAIVGLPGKILAFAGEMVAAGAALIQALWDGAVAKFNEFVEWIKGIPGRIKDAIGRIDLSGIITWPKMPSWLGGSAEATTIPGRAAGGPIAAGRTYLVGEEGPELITPNRSGFVHNARDTASMGRSGGSGGAGSVTVSVSINNHGVNDPETLADQLAAVLQRKLRETMNGIQADIGYGVA